MLDAVDGLEARRLPARRREQADREVGALAAVVQRVEAGARSAGRRRSRACRRAPARRRSDRARRAAARARSAPRAARAPRRARRSGKTSFAHAGVGHGTIDQLVVRSLTTLPDSLTDGSRSRPARTGSRSSSRPGAVGPESAIRAARDSPSASSALAVPGRHELQRVLARVLDARALHPRVEPGRRRRTARRGGTRSRRARGPGTPSRARRRSRRSGPAAGWPRSRPRGRRGVRSCPAPLAVKSTDRASVVAMQAES